VLQAVLVQVDGRGVAVRPFGLTGVDCRVLALGAIETDLSRISGRALQPLPVPVPAMTGSEQLGGRRLPPTLRSHNSARRPPPRWYKKRLADNFYIEQRATTTPRSSAGDHR
jgi:hypothetical protein